MVTQDPGGNFLDTSIQSSFSDGSLDEGHSNGLSLLDEFDGVSFCDFDPVTTFPSGAILNYISASAIFTSENGGQLYFVLNPSPPSTLCFNFVDESFTFEQFFDITGGTGQFEGATGSIFNTGSGQIVADNHGAFEFQFTGLIHTFDDDD